MKTKIISATMAVVLLFTVFAMTIGAYSYYDYAGTHRCDVSVSVYS